VAGGELEANADPPGLVRLPQRLHAQRDVEPAQQQLRAVAHGRERFELGTRRELLARVLRRSAVRGADIDVLCVGVDCEVDHARSRPPSAICTQPSTSDCARLRLAARAEARLTALASGSLRAPRRV
jgi:hypothetical protein